MIKFSQKDETEVVMISVVVISHLISLRVPFGDKTRIGLRLAERLMKLDLDKSEDQLVEEAKIELQSILLDESLGS